mmetsp:Transcript_44858/g.91577  ORF Transcript_44858/g.91577 Transcript_44858/m.91577 type:complete len:136 (+) Transcript_44858:104-511(+)
MSSYTFAIVGKLDNPLYELVSSHKKEGPQVAQENQFFLHAALDIVDEELWKSNSMFLKVVDKFNDRCISAYVTATNIKLMLLHDGNKGDDAIKSFFSEVHELYLKVMLNPFFDPNVPIASQLFDTRVRAIARKVL